MTRWQHIQDRRRASEVLGRELKLQEAVHHHTDGTLIICQDQAYHSLLHQRMDALKACGHADWRKCWYCSEYDDSSNLYIARNKKGVWHRKCRNRYAAEYNARTNYNKKYNKGKKEQLVVINDFLCDLIRIGG